MNLSVHWSYGVFAEVKLTRSHLNSKSLNFFSRVNRESNFLHIQLQGFLFNVIYNTLPQRVFHFLGSWLTFPWNDSNPDGCYCHTAFECCLGVRHFDRKEYKIYVFNLEYITKYIFITGWRLSRDQGVSQAAPLTGGIRIRSGQYGNIGHTCIYGAKKSSD